MPLSSSVAVGTKRAVARLPVGVNAELTTRFVAPVTEPEVAVIVALPVPTPAANPPALSDTTDATDVDQSMDPVRPECWHQ